MANTVDQVMVRNPIIVSADSPVSQAARRMADADVCLAVVTDDNGGVVGICTDRDVTVRVTAPMGMPRTDGRPCPS